MLDTTKEWVDRKFKVNIRDFMRAVYYIDTINQQKLNELMIMDEEGRTIEVSDEELDEWRFTGLNNRDFIIQLYSKINEER